MFQSFWSETYFKSCSSSTNALYVSKYLNFNETIVKTETCVFLFKCIDRLIYIMLNIGTQEKVNVWSSKHVKYSMNTRQIVRYWPSFVLRIFNMLPFINSWTSRRNMHLRFFQSWKGRKYFTYSNKHCAKNLICFYFIRCKCINCVHILLRNVDL